MHFKTRGGIIQTCVKFFKKFSIFLLILFYFLISEVLSDITYEVVKYKFKYNMQTGTVEKTKVKKITMYVKHTGMFDDNYKNAGFKALLNGTEVRSHKFNKKEVVSEIVYFIESKLIHCLETITGGPGGCFTGTVGVTETYFNTPQMLYQLDFIKKSIKKSCRTQKKKKNKEECDKMYHYVDSAMTKSFTENKIFRTDLFFYDENKKSLKHKISRYFMEPEIILILEKLNFHLSELDNIKGQMDNYAYSQKIVKDSSFIPFEETLSETVTTPIKNPSENKIIEEVISSIKNLAQSNIPNPKLDPKLEEKIYSIMIAAEKRLGTGKLYLQNRN